MISKELLSVVLNKNIISIESISTTCKFCYEKNSLNKIEYINIYELIHQMQMWAFGEGYKLAIYRNFMAQWICIDIISNDEMYGDTAFEAICKFCEVVLNDIKK